MEILATLGISAIILIIGIVLFLIPGYVDRRLGNGTSFPFIIGGIVFFIICALVYGALFV